MNNTLYIVVPCYNEEEALPATAPILLRVLEDMTAEGKVSQNSRILFVDDGSKDKTWEVIKGLRQENEKYTGIKLAKNAGHQHALLAGLREADADMTVTIDADLQDDPNAIAAMVDGYLAGYDVVYGVRDDRKSDTFFKRTTAQLYYKLLKLMGADIVYNHADYRLLSRRATAQLLKFNEANVFLRGLIPMLGYKSKCVYYERRKRTAGESKYTPAKMLSLAWDGVTSLSVKPLKFITLIGILMVLLSAGMLVYFLARHFCGMTVSGWTSIAVSLWFIGGLNLFALGVIGEYIGKIYKESKRRPESAVEEKTE